MRYHFVLLIVVFWGMSIAGCTNDKDGQTIKPLIDDSMNDWQCYLAEADVRQQDVWQVLEGVLNCKGKPLGYLYTTDDYSDFELTLEWRWPAGIEPGKGGVLIRMTGEHGIWPRSLEAQINAGDAGDFWGLDGYTLSGPAERTKQMDHEKFGQLTHVAKSKPMEKPAGQWNTYKIIAKGDTVTLFINGQKVNQATGCDTTPGKICLTSEGNPIQFRNVEIRLLGGE